MARTASFVRQVIGDDIVFIVQRARFPVTNLIFGIFALLLVNSIPVINVMLLGVIIYRVAKMSRDSRPVRISVGVRDLTFGHRSVPFADIAELSVIGPNGVELASSSTIFIGVGPAGMAMAAAGALAHASGQVAARGLAFMANRANARQFELRVRRRSHSTPIRIVRGLTSEAAQALLGDLTEDLRTRMQSAQAIRNNCDTTGTLQGRAVPMKNAMQGSSPTQAQRPAPDYHSSPSSPHAPAHGFLGTHHQAPTARKVGLTIPTQAHHPVEAGPPTQQPYVPSSRTVVAAPQGIPATDGRTACTPSMPSTILRFTRGPLVDQAIPIGPSTLIGREAAVSKLVIGHPEVSSAHAWIGWNGASIVFLDRGSTNGSTINGVSIRAGDETPIRAGDVISLGRSDAVSFVVEEGHA